MAPASRRGHGVTVAHDRYQLGGSRLAAIRQVMAHRRPSRTQRPGVATWARGGVGDDRRYGGRRLAAIRQVMADDAKATERPGVATRARGRCW
jgi:hypothetical protein